MCETVRLRHRTIRWTWLAAAALLSAVGGCGGEEELQRPMVVLEGPAGQTVQVRAYHIDGAGDDIRKVVHDRTVGEGGEVRIELADHGAAVVIRMDVPADGEWTLRLLNDGRVLGQSRSARAGETLEVAFGDVPPPPYDPQQPPADPD